MRRLTRSAYRAIPDRIEAGTLLLAAAITRGSITVYDAAPQHLQSVLRVLGQCGAKISVNGTTLQLHSPQRPVAFDFAAKPYPGIPTDLQAQLIALLATVDRKSTVADHVFPER